MTNTDHTTTEFFQQYAGALLARDAAAIASMYAVPSLILFPGQSIVVTDPGQTEQFFAASWGQYDGVDTVNHEISIIAEGPSAVWADVTWSYDGRVQERFCYQLAVGDQGAQIAVLTPLSLTDGDR